VSSEGIVGAGREKLLLLYCRFSLPVENRSPEAGRKRMNDLGRHDLVLLSELQRDSRQTVQ
jgi:hypothetical protein